MENCLTFVDQEHLGLEISAQIVIVERKCHLHEFFQQQVQTMSIITNGDIICHHHYHSDHHHEMKVLAASCSRVKTRVWSLREGPGWMTDRLRQCSSLQ